MPLTDKTGAPLRIAKEEDKFTVSVDGKVVGLAAFSERDGQRIFHHTEVDEEFGGRGIATVLVGEALAATRADGVRIVAVCPMVAAHIKKHHEFDDIVDPPTREILRGLES